MKIFISGYGRMGRMVEKIVLAKQVEYAGWSENVTEVDRKLASECVCIDFTTPDAFKANYEFLAENFKAVVVGTTGWDDIKTKVIGSFYISDTPMIYSANFSIGVNAVFAAVDKVCEALRGYNYIPHIEEIHHSS